MKFHFGPFPGNPAFIPDVSWQPLDEPEQKSILWVVLPLGLFTVAAFIILWFFLTPQSWIYFKYWFFIENSYVDIAILIAALAVTHELIHAMFHPGYGLTSQTVLGLWLSKGALYAHWDGEWSRNRAMACLLMPFVVLSVIPLLVCMLPDKATLWLDYITKSMLCFVSIFNALCACGDLMGARLFFRQIPATGILRNKGYYTYWRH